MLKEGCEPGTENRCYMSRAFRERGIPYSTRNKMIKSMIGQPEYIREEIAGKLLKIIETSENEEEMLKRAKAELE